MLLVCGIAAGCGRDSAGVRRIGNRRPELAELVAAVRSDRPFEPRLSGGFAYGPYRSSTRADRPQELSPDVRIAIARLEKKAAASRSDADWAALGDAYLVAGDLDRGLEFLEAAVATAVPDPTFLSDLAAAYLLVAEKRDRADLAPRAVASAEQACRLDGHLAEAAFNRALALEAIHLPGQAQVAWRTFRSLDSGSDWSREALLHLSRIDEETAANRRDSNAIDATIDAALKERTPNPEATRPIRYQLRTRIETTLLPEWANRELTGDRAGAEEALGRARMAADLLVRAGGDSMAADAVTAIEKADRLPDRAAAKRLARAHLGVKEAADRFDAGQVTKAEEQFRLVTTDLVAARDPYALWSGIYHAVAEFGARHFSSALEALTAPAIVEADGRYRFLAGRRRWLVGLIASNEGRLTQALAEYEDAQAEFQAVGEINMEISVTALAAEILGRLGSPRQAWEYERRLLSQSAHLGAMDRWELLLQLGGALCLNADLPAAALHFQDALITGAATRMGREAPLVEAYFHRAQIDQRLGDSVAARADLERARSILGRVTDAQLQRRERAEIFAAEADVLRAAAPEQAAVSATKAIDFFRDPGGETRIPGLYLRRALAYSGNRRFDLAENDLREAIKHFEQQRSGFSARQYRASFFQDGWQSFAEMARLQAVLKKGDIAALDYAERGRARTLLEAAANTNAAQPLTASEVQRQLGDDTAAVFYVTLDDRLLIFSVRRRSIALFERPTGSAPLRAAVNRIRWLLRQSANDDSRLRAELIALHRELIGPVSSTLDGVSTLVLIPDGPLHALPFAALVNPASGRYLVQDFVVQTAPSLSTMVAASGSQSAFTGSSPRAIVIGNPSRERTGDESLLPSLPFSEQEAEQVASIYSSSLLLTAQRATKQSMLDHISEYDIVHYAGHALVDDQVPALSRLLLAPDAAGQDDGSLFVSDLGKLRLTRTRLVVLAACSTGTGQISNGEGVQSLARPFLEAGASWVAATFWDIQDRSAADFFLAFHRRVAAGEWPADALSRVQRQLITNTDRARRSPSQWAWAALIGTIRQPTAH